MNNRKLILYIACSLDGYIAKPGDDLSFLKTVQKPGEDYGYNHFIQDIDSVVVGRRTYDWVLNQGYSFPHADKEAYIITRTERPAIGNMQFYTGNLAELVSSIKAKSGKNIFVDGGAEIVDLLMKEKLIDEFYISIIPILLGDGIRLFKRGEPEQMLKLVEAKSFDTGLVQLHYVLKT